MMENPGKMAGSQHGITLDPFSVFGEGVEEELKITYVSYLNH